MKTIKIEISEEQLLLIRAACLFAHKHNGDLTRDESEEIDMIAEMILNTIEVVTMMTPSIDFATDEKS